MTALIFRKVHRWLIERRRCAHAERISADRWPDNVRLSDLEPLFVCQACGRRGADIRPDWDWELSRRASG